MRIGKYKIEKRFFAFLFLIVAVVFLFKSNIFEKKEDNTLIEGQIRGAKGFYLEVFEEIDEKYPMLLMENNVEEWSSEFRNITLKIKTYEKPAYYEGMNDRYRTSIEIIDGLEGKLLELLTLYNEKFITEATDNDFKIQELISEFNSSLSMLADKINRNWEYYSEDKK